MKRSIIAIALLTLLWGAQGTGVPASKTYLAAGNFYPSRTLRDDGSSLYYYQQKVDELQRELRSKKAEIEALKKELLEKEKIIANLKKENETLVEQTIRQRSKIEELSRTVD